MFGYACNETEDLDAAPIHYSRTRSSRMADARHKGEGDAGFLGPTPRARSPCVTKTANLPSAIFDRRVDPARPEEDFTRTGRRQVLDPDRSSRPCAGRHHDRRQRVQLVHQSDRQVRHRRPGWRCGPDRPQDHRRHLLLGTDRSRRSRGAFNGWTSAGKPVRPCEAEGVSPQRRNSMAVVRPAAQGRGGAACWKNACRPWNSPCRNP